MVRRFYKREKTLVGIHINTSEVNFVVLHANRQNSSVLDQGQHPLKDLPDIINYIKKSADFSCHVALSHRFMIFKHLVFTESFTDKEIYELLTLNAGQYFLEPMEEMLFDCELTGVVKNKARVLASKRDYIQEFKKQFDNAGLKPTVMTADVIAIEQFLLYHDLVNKDEVYAVFTLSGNELVQIVLIEGRAFFMITRPVTERNRNFIFEEVAYFFQTYESSKSFRLPITRIIFLGFNEESMVPSKNSFSLPLIQEPDPLIIAKGVALPC